MAKTSLCHLVAALLCGIALLSSTQAAISAAEDKLEARNDEGVMELGQQQQAPAKPLPMQIMLTDIPAKTTDIDDKMDGPPAAKPVAAANEKMDKQPVKSVGKQTAATPVAAANVEDAESKPGNMEFVINHEVHKQPGMARLARRLKSFHNYQLRRAQSRAANNIQNEYVDDEEDDGIVPEERAIRRRQRVRRRNANNRLRRTNRRQNVSQRRHNINRGQSVRRPTNMKKSTYRRGSNNRRNKNKKSSKPKSSNKKRRSGQKKSTRKTKQKSSKAKRSKKGRRSNRREVENENPARQQASHLIVFMDGDVPVAKAA